MKVSILTAALPTRRDMLAEATASIEAQVCPGVDVEHLWAIDEDREGAGAVLNRLLTIADGEWVMVADDDDLLDPHHVATVTSHTDDVDVVYTLPRVEGGSFSQYHAPFDPSRLAANHNMVSHNALMRASLVRQVGGWADVRHFDLAMFQQLEQAGADFRQIREVTWTYRLHDSNWSHGTLDEAAF